MPEQILDTVIRENQSNEKLGDAKLSKEELEAINNLKNSLDGKVKDKDKIGKADAINPFIKEYFSFYDQNINSNTNEFSENRQEDSDNKEKVDIFYNKLLTDLRSQYESMSYEKDGEENVNILLNLASFYIDLYSGDDAVNYVRSDNNIQQTEEKFKGIMRRFDEKIKLRTQIIESKNPEIPIGFHLKETKNKMKEGPKQSLDARYDLDPGMIGDKDTIEKSFEGIKNTLNKENIKIKSFEITGLSSKTNYIYGNKEVKIGNETLILTDNTSLADARSKIAENRFKTNFGDKLDSGCLSKISYQSEVGPDYKQGEDNFNDEKYREAQGVRFKVEYTEVVPDNTYVFEKNKAISPSEGYNQQPKSEIFIKDPNKEGLLYEYSQIEVSGRYLNSIDGVAGSNQNNLIRSNREKSMFRDDGVLSKWFQKYKNFSEQNPLKYPKIEDPKNDLSWVDKMDWTNNMEYGVGEQTSLTPILNIDLNNLVHKGIFEEMKTQGVIVEKDGQYIMPPTKTDKYIAEYVSKRTKIYLKDAIKNGKRNYKG